MSSIDFREKIGSASRPLMGQPNNNNSKRRPRLEARTPLEGIYKEDQTASVSHSQSDRPFTVSYRYTSPFDSEAARQRNYTTSTTPLRNENDDNHLFNFHIAPDDEASHFSQQELIRNKVKSRRRQERKPPRIPVVAIPHRSRVTNGIPLPTRQPKSQSSLSPFPSPTAGYRLQDDDDTSSTIFRSFIQQEFTDGPAETSKTKQDGLESSSTAETTKSSLEHQRDTKQLIKDSYQLISRLEEKRQYEQQQSLLKQKLESKQQQRGVRFDAKLFDEESSVPFDQRYDETFAAQEPGKKKHSPVSVTQMDARTPTSITQHPRPKSILKASRFQGSPSPISRPPPNYSFHYDEPSAKRSNTKRSPPIGEPKPTKRSPMPPLKLFENEPVPNKVTFTHQRIVDVSTAELSSIEIERDLSRIASGPRMGHPAEKHLHNNLAAFRNSIAYRVLEEQFPDPPSIIKIEEEDDDTVPSAYLFIETVAAIVIQTAVRRFLAFLSVQRRLRYRRVQQQDHNETLESEISVITYESSFGTRDGPSNDAVARKRRQADDAATKIQAVFRGYWVRDCLDIDHYCAISIQAAYRSYAQRWNYIEDRQRVIIVQSWWRRNIARESVAHLLACAIIIQAAARRRIIRKKYLRFQRRKAAVQFQAAVLIQAVVRGRIIRRKYLRFQRKKAVLQFQAAALIQAVVRGHRIRWRYRRYLLKKYRIMNAAATRIQSAWRGVVCESNYFGLLVDVLIVQTVARRWLAMRRVGAIRKRRYRLNHRVTSNRAVTDGYHSSPKPEIAGEMRRKTKAQSQELRSPTQLSTPKNGQAYKAHGLAEREPRGHKQPQSGIVSPELRSLTQPLSQNGHTYKARGVPERKHRGHKQPQSGIPSQRARGVNGGKQYATNPPQTEPVRSLNSSFGRKTAVIAYPDDAGEDTAFKRSGPSAGLPKPPKTPRKYKATSHQALANDSTGNKSSRQFYCNELEIETKPVRMERSPQKLASPRGEGRNLLLQKWKAFERENAMKSGNS